MKLNIIFLVMVFFQVRPAFSETYVYQNKNNQQYFLSNTIKADPSKSDYFIFGNSNINILYEDKKNYGEIDFYNKVTVESKKYKLIFSKRSKTNEFEYYNLEIQEKRENSILVYYTKLNEQNQYQIQEKIVLRKPLTFYQSGDISKEEATENLNGIVPNGGSSYHQFFLNLIQNNMGNDDLSSCNLSPSQKEHIYDALANIVSSRKSEINNGLSCIRNRDKIRASLVDLVLANIIILKKIKIKCDPNLDKGGSYVDGLPPTITIGKRSNSKEEILKTLYHEILHAAGNVDESVVEEKDCPIKSVKPNGVRSLNDGSTNFSHVTAHIAAMQAQASAEVAHATLEPKRSPAGQVTQVITLSDVERSLSSGSLSTNGPNGQDSFSSYIDGPINTFTTGISSIIPQVTARSRSVNTGNLNEPNAQQQLLSPPTGIPDISPSVAVILSSSVGAPDNSINFGVNRQTTPANGSNNSGSATKPSNSSSGEPLPPRPPTSEKKESGDESSRSGVVAKATGEGGLSNSGNVNSKGEPNNSSLSGSTPSTTTATTTSNSNIQISPLFDQKPIGINPISQNSVLSKTESPGTTRSTGTLNDNKNKSEPLKDSRTGKPAKEGVPQKPSQQKKEENIDELIQRFIKMPYPQILKEIKNITIRDLGNFKNTDLQAAFESLNIEVILYTKGESGKIDSEYVVPTQKEKNKTSIIYESHTSTPTVILPGEKR